MAIWLLNNGADPNLLPSHTTETIIYHAVRRRNIELVRLLLEKGTEIRGIGPLGWSTLEVAVLSGSPEIVKLLVESGVAIDTIDDGGFTPLLAGIEFGKGDQATIIDILVDAGADVNRTNKRNQTALELAEKHMEDIEQSKYAEQWRKDKELAYTKTMLERVKYHKQRSDVLRKKEKYSSGFVVSAKSSKPVVNIAHEQDGLIMPLAQESKKHTSAKSILVICGILSVVSVAVLVIRRNKK